MAETMLRPETPADPLSGSSKPITDYGLLSDCNTAALVARDGSIDWLCLPRFDAPAVFASILDAGRGALVDPPGRPVHERAPLRGRARSSSRPCSRREAGVVPASMRWPSSTGSAATTSGWSAPHELLRSVEGVAGTVELQMELAPRPSTASSVRSSADGRRRAHVRRPQPGRRPRRRAHRGGGWHDAGGVHGRARATRSGSRSAGSRPTHREAPEATAPEAVAARIDDTVETWRSWEAEHYDLRRPAPRPGAPELPRPPGPHVSPHGCDRRRADHLAARDRRR